MIDTQLLLGSLHPFMKAVKQAILDDKLWDLYLHSATKKSFNAWKEEVLNNG